MIIYTKQEEIIKVKTKSKMATPSKYKEQFDDLLTCTICLETTATHIERIKVNCDHIYETGRNYHSQNKI